MKLPEMAGALPGEAMTIGGGDREREAANFRGSRRQEEEIRFFAIL